MNIFICENFVNVLQCWSSTLPFRQYLQLQTLPRDYQDPETPPKTPARILIAIKTPPRRHGDTTELHKHTSKTPQKHPQDTSDTPLKHHQKNTKVPPTPLRHKRGTTKRQAPRRRPSAFRVHTPKLSLLGNYNSISTCEILLSGRSQPCPMFFSQSDILLTPAY